MSSPMFLDVLTKGGLIFLNRHRDVFDKTSRQHGLKSCVVGATINNWSLGPYRKIISHILVESYRFFKILITMI